jgi:hypothetical protein
MRPSKKSSVLLFLPSLATLVACSVTDNGLTKKRIVINRNHKYVYKIGAPTGDTGIVKTYGGHGHGFEVRYRDSSFVYYTNDMYFATPNYFDNYKSINFTTPVGGLQVDTILQGEQKDGKYWKEIFHNGYYIGYKNVPKEKVELFDNSLTTFKRKR